MIVVQVSLTAKEALGFIHIQNDGAGNAATGNYVVQLYEGQGQSPKKQAFLKGWDRTQHWLPLVEMACKLMGAEE